MIFYLQISALSVVEAKRRFEFLEAVSGTMDAHLRFFKQVPQWSCDDIKGEFILEFVCCWLWIPDCFRDMSCCTRWSLSLTRSSLILIVPSQKCTVKKSVQFPQKAYFSFQKQFLKSLILVSRSCPFFLSFSFLCGWKGIFRRKIQDPIIIIPIIQHIFKKIWLTM